MEYFSNLMENFSKLVEYFLKLVMHLEFNGKGTTSALRFTNTLPTFFHSPAIFFLTRVAASESAVISVMVILVKIENRQTIFQHYNKYIIIYLL